MIAVVALLLALIVTGCSEGGLVDTTAETTSQVPLVELSPEPRPTEIPLPVKVAESTKSVSPGDRASITVRTTGGAKCSISVLYESGESEAKGLSSKRAGSSGNASWAWTVGANTNPQTALVTVTCEANGRTGSVMSDMTVR